MVVMLVVVAVIVALVVVIMVVIVVVMAVMMMAMIVVMVVVIMMVVRMIVMIVLVVTVLVIVWWRHRGADRVQRPAQAPHRVEEAPALGPDQPRANQRDQRVARELDDTLGAAHLAGGGVEQCRGDADDRNRNQRLKQRGSERQHDAAPPRFLVGDQV